MSKVGMVGLRGRDSETVRQGEIEGGREGISEVGMSKVGMTGL